MSGWIAELGYTDKFSHYFGGSGWKVRDPQEVAGGPHLILDVDLSDPVFKTLFPASLDRLPICSYINCDFWIEPQYFQLVPETRDAILVRRGQSYTSVFDGQLKFPNPLAAKRISLRRMSTNECVSDERSRSLAIEGFLGGKSFIRILGAPIWLQKDQEPMCLCNSEQLYVCSIGYEKYNEPAGFLDDRPFFIGEAALYFFLCRDCLILAVYSQST